MSILQLKLTFFVRLCKAAHTTPYDNVTGEHIATQTNFLIRIWNEPYSLFFRI